MIDTLKDFFEAISIIDLIYLIITILSLITCYKKGFVLSILSIAKWLLAYVITLILFPRVKPYFQNIIDNEKTFFGLSYVYGPWTNEDILKRLSLFKILFLNFLKFM